MKIDVVVEIRVRIDSESELEARRIMNGALAHSVARFSNNPFVLEYDVTTNTVMVGDASATSALYRCPHCKDTGFLCIHCDKDLDTCKCPDNGARNPGTCRYCWNKVKP